MKVGVVGEYLAKKHPRALTPAQRIVNTLLMAPGPVVLDTDTLSELSPGNTLVKARAASYLAEFGRLTITAVTVFDRLRGYRAAIRTGSFE